MVCAGELDLTTPQQAIASDWIAAYKRYESPNPRLNRANTRLLSPRDGPFSYKHPIVRSGSKTSEEYAAGPGSRTLDTGQVLPSSLLRRTVRFLRCFGSLGLENNSLPFASR